MKHGAESWGRRYVADMLMQEALARKGLPEASLEVMDWADGFWLALHAPSRGRSGFVRLPGLPKDPFALVELAQEVLDWLVDELKKFPEIPKEQRVHEVAPGRFFVPGVTPLGREGK